MGTLAELLPKERIMHLESTDKDGALQELLGLVSRSEAVKDPNDLTQAILAREVIMSTGVGYGVAIPHARVKSVDRFVLALGVSDGGIAYGSVIDDLPVRIVCMIAGPDQAQDGYLKLLSTLMKFIKSEKGHIMASRSAEEISRFARAYPLELTSSPSSRDGAGKQERPASD